MVQCGKFLFTKKQNRIGGRVSFLYFHGVTASSKKSGFPMHRNSAFVLLTSMLDPQSEQATHIYHLTNYFFIAAAFILLLVSVLTIVFLYKFKAKAGDKEPEQQKGNKKLELLMVGVPLAMVVVFFFLMLNTMKKVLPPAGDDAIPEVIITGHQWWWEANYPQSGVVTANEIHLPAGRKILLRFLSADVIHDWWVPQLGNKMDLIPGRENHLWLTISKPGFYEGACSEFCGEEHAWMRIRVYAESETDYQAWLQKNKTAAAPPASALAQQGALLFETETCAGCHKIEGTKANGNEGPVLTHFASRKTMLTGLLQNNETNLNLWLDHPQKIKPGAYMPDFLLTEKSRKALVAYLLTLR